MKYIFHVSYSWSSSRGEGFGSVQWSTPISSINLQELENIRKRIIELNKFKSVIIIFWQLLETIQPLKDIPPQDL